MSDFYDDLGIDPDATDDEIKKAWRAEARKHHPDQGGDSEKFKTAQRAYMVLSDSKRRADYDAGNDDGNKAPDSDHIKAVSFLTSLYLGIIDSGEAFADGADDPLPLIRGKIDDAECENRKSVARLKAKIKKAKKLIKRTRKKTDGDNIFTNALETRVRSYRQTIKNLKSEIEIGYRMREILRDYEFETDFEAAFISMLPSSMSVDFRTFPAPDGSGFFRTGD